MLSGCDGECALECSGRREDSEAEARSPVTPSAPLRCECECGGGDWKKVGPLAIDAHTSTVAMVAVMGDGPSAEDAEAEEEAAKVAVEGAVEPAAPLT